MTDATTAAAAAAVVAALAVSRLLEIRRSRANVRALRARGARPMPGDLFAALAVLHVAFLIGLPVEVWAAATKPPAWWPLWLALWAGGEGLRIASIRALGDRWTVGVYVVPGQARCRRGPYRYLHHPNYIGVILELAAAALLVGAWRTALLASAANLALLAIRVRREERALAAAEQDVSAAPSAR